MFYELKRNIRRKVRFPSLQITRMYADNGSPTAVAQVGRGLTVNFRFDERLSCRAYLRSR